jgi:hypothetical protein
MLFRSFSAGSQTLASKPMVAVESLDEEGLLEALRAISYATTRVFVPDLEGGIPHHWQWEGGDASFTAEDLHFIGWGGRWSVAGIVETVTLLLESAVSESQ